MNILWKTSPAESTSIHGEESSSVSGDGRPLNSENDDTDSQISDSNHTWRRSRKHTNGKAGKWTQQLMMISALSAGRM